MDEIMGKEEAARFLRIGTRTLEQYMHDGRIRFSYVKGRTNKRVAFQLEDLEALKTEIAGPIYPNQRRIVPKRRTRQELFDALSQDARQIQGSINRLRADVCFLAEVLLVEAGRGSEEARAWVQQNLSYNEDGL